MTTLLLRVLVDRVQPRVPPVFARRALLATCKTLGMPRVEAKAA